MPFANESLWNPRYGFSGFWTNSNFRICWITSWRCLMLNTWGIRFTGVQYQTTVNIPSPYKMNQETRTADHRTSSRKFSTKPCIKERLLGNFPRTRLSSQIEVWQKANRIDREVSVNRSLACGPRRFTGCSEQRDFRNFGNVNARSPSRLFLLFRVKAKICLKFFNWHSSHLPGWYLEITRYLDI